MVFCVGFFSLLFYLFIYYFCLFFVWVFCVYVCMYFFFGGWVGVFLTGGGCVVPCSCTKDKNSIKMLLLVLFPIPVQNTGHIFLLLMCIVALGQKKRHVSCPRPCPKIAPHLFFILYFIFKFHARKRRQNIFRHAQ